MRILIIPDIHGRTFWKSPVKRQIKRVDKIVFLGDYMDPYQDEEEKHTYKEALENFNEILELKRNNPDKVILLLGNHDFHYMNKQFDDVARSTRFDSWHAFDLRKLYNDNANLFQLCYCVDNYNKKVIFSHAGITNFWFETAKLNLDTLENDVNNMVNSEDGVSKLSIIGKYRTWFGEETGSPLWCDIQEFMKDKGLGKDTYQIFGHTRLKKGVSIHMGGFSCIDSQYAFVLNAKNKLKRVEDEKVKTNKKQPDIQDTEDAK